MGRNTKSSPSYLEVEGNVITKPTDIANYFNNYFKEKVEKLRTSMPNSDNSTSYLLIKNKIMKDKIWKFKLDRVSRSRSRKNDKDL